jgi:hypothetical protein
LIKDYAIIPNILIILEMGIKMYSSLELCFTSKGQRIHPILHYLAFGLSRQGFESGIIS